jgi:hypothetical protein
MSLENWLANGWLVGHQTSKQEIRDLLGVVDRDLKDASTKGLSADWRMAITYNAALQCAVAALAVAGYRTGRQAHHYYAIESLALTIGLADEDVRTIDMFRKKRNIADYERSGVVSDAEVSEFLELTRDLRQKLVAWITDKQPELLESTG